MWAVSTWAGCIGRVFADYIALGGANTPMTSFAFTKSDLLLSLGIALAAVAAFAWSQAMGTPLPITPVLSLCIVFANVLVNGYYNAKCDRRALEVRVRIEAQPLVELKAELIRELTEGRDRIQKLRQEADALQAAAAINSLNREAVRSLLMAVTRPTLRSIWVERSFGFFSGIAASLVASAVYELARR